MLKVRSSYGLTGNNAIGRNEYQSLIGFGVSYNGHAGINPIQLGRIGLTWEKKRAIEFGLKFGFFNRIDGNVTYFHNKTFDLLYQIPLSRTTGFNSQLTNIGKLANHGIGVSLDIDIIKSKQFLLSLSGTFTYVTDEITELPTDANGNPLTIKRTYQIYAAVGHPVGEWYMKTWAGVNPQNGLPLWQINDHDGNPGEVTSNYNKANPEYQGASGTPTHYGSIGLSLNYRGFYFNANLFGSFGNKIYGIWMDYIQADGAYQPPGFNSLATQLNRWTHPGQKTDVPRRVQGGNHNSNGLSTRYLYDGDFLRLQTVRLGYRIPTTVLNKLDIGVQSLNIYLIGHNVWTYAFDDDLVWDPQTSNGGFLDLYNQALKSYSIGIQVKF